MSRSRKKTAIFKQKNNKWYKRQSNKRSEKPTYHLAVRFDVLRIRMIFVIMHDSRGLKKWKRPPESNEKRYFPVINKSKKNKKKYDFLRLGVDK